MAYYEYTVVPAPRKAARARGLRGADQRFAHALAEVINLHAAEGWEYQRAEQLPCEERSGILGRATSVKHVLVFRRELSVDGVIGEPDFAASPYADEPPTPEQMAADLDAGRTGPQARLQALRNRVTGGKAPELGPARGEAGARVHPLPSPGAREPIE